MSDPLTIASLSFSLAIGIVIALTLLGFFDDDRMDL